MTTNTLVSPDDNVLTSIPEQHPEDEQEQAQDDNGDNGDALVVGGGYSVTSADDDDSKAQGDTGDGDRSGSGIKEHAAELERQNLARKETRAVRYLRYIVVGMLLLTAIVVSLGVYFYTKQDEVEDFEQAFAAQAYRVIESFHSSVSLQLSAFDALSVSYTSHALSTGSIFPNVTLPHMELRGANTRIISRGFVAHFFPLVTNEERRGWEAYAVEHKGHQMQSFLTERTLIAQQDTKFGYTSTAATSSSSSSSSSTQPTGTASSSDTSTNTNNQGNRFLQGAEALSRPFSPVIIDDYGKEEPEGSGPFFPLWQSTPTVPLPGVMTLNTLRFPLLTEATLQVWKTGQAYINRGVAAEAFYNLFLTRGQYRHQNEELQSDAATPVGYPVFDNFNVTSRSLVGVISGNIYWRLYLKNILPPNVEGIIVVLKNTVNQTYTYQINGDSAIFLDEVDLHDTQYDNLVVSADVVDYLTSESSPETRSFLSADLNQDGIRYTIQVYPSDEFKMGFITQRPMWYALIVALIFIFTSAVFLAYDVVVERRQKIVLERAVKSSAVVSSLFPEAVRERILNGDEDEDKKRKKIQSVWRIDDKREETLGQLGQQQQQPSSRGLGGRPIADRFPACTVFFGDLAGFTQWSSEREPDQVFILLERLYGAFDAIALKRVVFKVETIGDCYLAATGLPVAQPDHAVIMAKFARDCIEKMNDLIANELVQELGRDTAELQLRAGLHSGQVTAGVLRGDRSRFQLFGDTVNVAARMESLGIQGRIHCSQSTADALILAGKKQWIVPREDKITAKGKGVMQTYFLDGMTTVKSVGQRSGIFQDSPSVGVQRTGIVQDIEEEE